MPPPFDTVLTAVVLAAALMAVVRLFGLSTRARRRLLLGWGFLVLVLALTRAEARLLASSVPPANRPLLERTDGYVSSQACLACHPNQYDSWQSSYHSTMTTLPTDETVFAPFDGETLSYLYEYRPHRRGGDFWIQTNDPDWAEPGESLPVARRVALVTGSHHQQLYWFERAGTRGVGRFPFFFRIPEQRWVPFHSALLTSQKTAEGAGDHWSTVCIRCHATHGKPRFDLDDMGTMDTRVAEFGIGCESCHGPGQAHVEAHRNVLRRYWHHFFRDSDDTIVNPARLPADRSIDVCGQCHAVQSLGSQARIRQWSRNGMPFRPGDDLARSRYIFDLRSGDPSDAFLQRTIRNNPHFAEDRFWPDGVVNVSGREYQGVRDSPCYISGEFTCLTCHDMHQAREDSRAPVAWANDQLAPDAQDDAVCVGCHPRFAEPSVLEAHSHHPANSAGSSCYNCHMPNTAYGLLNATRSHYIENPDTRTQLATGRPNACNLCHLDQTLAWTAEKLEAWYGIAPPLFDDPEHRRTADGALLALRGDAGQRAVLAYHLGWEPAREASGAVDWAVPLLAELSNDPYEAVRTIAYRSLTSLPGYEQVEFDPLAGRQVRREARRDLLASWPGPREFDPASLGRVLVDPAGHSMRERIAALLKQRDDRRVFRAE